MNGQAASLDIFFQICDLQLVHIPGELGSVHRVGVDFRIQAIPFRGGEFLNRHSAQGQAL